MGRRPCREISTVGHHRMDSATMARRQGQISLATARLSNPARGSRRVQAGVLRLDNAMNQNKGCRSGTPCLLRKQTPACRHRFGL